MSPSVPFPHSISAPRNPPSLVQRQDVHQDIVLYPRGLHTVQDDNAYYLYLSHFSLMEIGFFHQPNQ
jgi:hypothetical protein